jgi:S1-C subfamily serine protease
MTTERSSLARLSDQLADAVDRASASIVAVHARPRLASTGVHWRDGLVVTTDATVRHDRNLRVTLPDGSAADATLVGRDRGTDLAVLRIAAGRLPVPAFGDPATLRPGHLVLALARLDGGGPRAAFGAVSATGGRWRCWKGGEIDLQLQSDLDLYPGFGGGPLVDVDGRIHGINSGGLSRPLATTIPVGTVDRVLGQLVERGYVARGWLGAALQPVRFGPVERQRMGVTQDGGLLVLSVEPDGPAASGGMMVGDVLVAVAGQAIDRPEQVLEALAGDVVGRSLVFDARRGGAPARLEILIGERPRRQA